MRILEALFVDLYKKPLLHKNKDTTIKGSRNFVKASLNNLILLFKDYLTSKKL